MASDAESNIPEEEHPKRRSTFTPPVQSVDSVQGPLGDQVRSIPETEESELAPSDSAWRIDNSLNELSERGRHSLIPPGRLSKTVAELEKALAFGLDSQGEDTLSLIELVEDEIQLRTLDVDRFRAWEENTLRLGSVEAQEAVMRARNAHPDLATSSPLIQPTERILEPDTAQEQDVQESEPTIFEVDENEPLPVEEADGLDALPEDVETKESVSVDPVSIDTDTFEEVSLDPRLGKEALVAGQRGLVSDEVAEALAELEREDIHGDTADSIEPMGDVAPIAAVDGIDEIDPVADGVTSTLERLPELIEPDLPKYRGLQNEDFEAILAGVSMQDVPEAELATVPEAEIVTTESEIISDTDQDTPDEPASFQFVAPVESVVERSDDEFSQPIILGEPETERADQEPATPIVPSAILIPDEETAPEELTKLKQPLFERFGIEKHPGSRKSALGLWALWSAIPFSALALLAGFIIFDSDLSLRQMLVISLIGAVLFGLVVTVGGYFGRSTGSPSMVVSRGIFGVYGNLPVAIISLVFRLLWTVLLLIFATWVTFTILSEIGVGGLSDEIGLLISFAIPALIVLFSVLVGYRAVAWLFTISFFGTLGLVVLLGVEQSSTLDFSTALSQHDTGWGFILGPIVLVFGIFALGLIHSAIDVARVKRSQTGGTGYQYVAGLGAFLALFVILALGAVLLLAAATQTDRFVQDPLDAILGMLPDWAVLPALIVTLLSLIAVTVLSAYSSAMMVLATDLRVNQPLAAALTTLVVSAGTAGVLFGAADQLPVLFDILLLLSVPVASWVGIMMIQAVIRQNALDHSSLRYAGGVYGAFNPLTLAIWVITSGLGMLFLTSQSGASWLVWIATGWEWLPISLEGLETSNAGILAAFLLAMILTAALCIPQVRHQEDAHNELDAESSWLD